MNLRRTSADRLRTSEPPQRTSAPSIDTAELRTFECRNNLRKTSAMVPRTCDRRGAVKRRLPADSGPHRSTWPRTIGFAAPCDSTGAKRCTPGRSVRRLTDSTPMRSLSTFRGHK